MRVVAVTGAEVPTGTALKTILQITAAANRELEIYEIGVSFDGTDAAGTPILVQIMRQTSAGTGGTSNDPVAMQGGGSVESTGLRGPAGAWGGEPTAGDELRAIEIHPNSGAWHYVVPNPSKFTTADAGRIAIVVTAAASVNCSAWIEAEE